MHVTKQIYSLVVKQVVSDFQSCPFPVLTRTRRQRALKSGESPYRALLETLELTNTRLTLQLINDNNKVDYSEAVLTLICFQFRNGILK